MDTGRFSRKASNAKHINDVRTMPLWHKVLCVVISLSMVFGLSYTLDSISEFFPNIFGTSDAYAESTSADIVNDLEDDGSYWGDANESLNNEVQVSILEHSGSYDIMLNSTDGYISVPQPNQSVYTDNVGTSAQTDHYFSY